jgi:hypothetical protein
LIALGSANEDPPPPPAPLRVPEAQRATTVIFVTPAGTVNVCSFPV